MLNNPLHGTRIVVTRSAEQADTLVAQLATLGAEVVAFPVIQFRPLPAIELDAALAGIDGYDWLVFTSSNAVRYFWARLGEAGLNPGQTRVAASGSATAALLRELGIEPDFIPDEFVGERLVEGLGDLAGQRVLLPRARIGRPEIATLLQQKGAIVDEIALYDTVTAEPDEAAWAALDKPVDCLTFTSPSSVRNWLKLMGQRGADVTSRSGPPAVACIGPITAAEAEKRGLPAGIIPAEYTIDELVAAIVEYFMEKESYADRTT